MTKFAAAIAPHFQNVNDQIGFFFFFTSISLCLTPPPPPPPSRQEKERKKERICDRVFFPFFTCITYWIDRLPTTSFYCYVLPKPFRVFFPCEAFLIFKFHWIHECASKKKKQWIPVLDVHTGTSSCKWSILTPGKMYKKCTKIKLLFF